MNTSRKNVYIDIIGYYFSLKKWGNVECYAMDELWNKWNKSETKDK